MRALIILFCVATVGLTAQPKKVTENVELSGQKHLDLEFTFADLIAFKTWDKNEILVEVEVEINDGEDNDIFTLSSSKTSSTVHIAMDKDMWKKAGKRNRNCSWQTTINYTVYLPAGIEVDANTISGNYEFAYYGTPMKLKTISGEIDVTVPPKQGLDFKAKTISGEVFSDIDIEFPYGEEGLRQIVGQKFYGRISNGGEESLFETISGNIFLRKG